MINGLPILLTHAAPIHQNYSLFPQLSVVEILPKAAVHKQKKKKLTFSGTFVFHEVFQGKEEWVVEYNTL